MTPQDNFMKVPAVSIGMPVYNGGQYVGAAIESLLEQTFEDFEIIISDNASTDQTSDICQVYAARDARIHYIRQTENIGALNNFLAVLGEARADYFKWHACDDTVSTDFIELNYNFLKAHPEYVASTSPNGFEGKPLCEQHLIDFALEGTVFERFNSFFLNCWDSHGIFYALTRREHLESCQVLSLGSPLFALDWSIDLYLASKGKINRTSDGSMVFGVNGVSRGADAYKVFRNSYIEFFLPFYYFSKYSIKLTEGISIKQKLMVFKFLIILNNKANRDRLRSWRRSVKRKLSISRFF